MRTNKRKSDVGQSNEMEDAAIPKKNCTEANSNGVSTPQKDTGVAVIYAVLMTTGDVNDFESILEKDEFVKEHEDIVVETKEFKNRTDFEEWKRAKALSTPSQTNTDGAKDGLTKMSPDVALKAQEAVSLVNDTRPAQEVRINWKTSPRSMAVCFVLRLIDRSK